MAVKLEMKPLQPGLLLHLCIFHVYIHVHGLTTYEYVRTQVTTWFSISTPNNRLLSARRDDRSAAASSCSCAPTTLLLLFVLFVVLLPLLLLL